MKHSFFCLFLFVFSINAYSQEKNIVPLDFNEKYYYSDILEYDMNIATQFIVPPPNKYSFGYLDFSVGISYGIVPRYFYLGVACDFAIGFDWFTLFSSDKDNNFNSEIPQIGLGAGGRIYCLLQMKNLKLWSFTGCDYLLFVKYPMLYAGIELSYKIVGLEYGYYFPIMDNGNPAKHRVALKFHMPKNG